MNNDKLNLVWDMETGDRVQSIEIDKVILNPTLEASIFAMPEGAGS